MKKTGLYNFGSKKNEFSDNFTVKANIAYRPNYLHGGIL
jgi:hypothetical protein